MISKTNKPLIVTTDLYWPGQGSGVVSLHSSDLSTPVSISMDSANQVNKWSAEQLLLTAITGSLLNTYLELSKNINLVTAGFECTTTGQVENIDGKLTLTFVHVYPKVYVTNERDIETSLILLEKAKKICMLYNAVTAEVTQHAEAVLINKKIAAA